ncbi:Uncharacterised protein [uncultured archaeon]|nr:Uncharacterised protein [uncultured archaeon]
MVSIGALKENHFLAGFARGYTYGFVAGALLTVFQWYLGVCC